MNYIEDGIVDIENKLDTSGVIKEGYAYEVLMKNATFEYSRTSGNTACGNINGYSLFTDDFLTSHDVYTSGYGVKNWLVIVDNGDNTYQFVACFDTGGIKYAYDDRYFYILCNSDTQWSVEVPSDIYNERNGDVKITILYGYENSLAKKDGTPLTKPLILDATIDYTVLPFKGDEALQAIIDGRQILVKVPNADGSNFTTNFMPVFQYQLPNHENSYLYLLYLKDGLATNLTNALGALMQGGTANFDAVYGSIKLALSKSYTECPLK